MKRAVDCENAAEMFSEFLTPTACLEAVLPITTVFCFVNGESRDEGVINTGKKLGQCCRLHAAANLILCVTSCFYSSTLISENHLTK